eukprot:gnl/MRDRNA2_/MRDRNA2_56509_c0_seq1.p1 gnl/MRDRNA2_/MRDRNA2_56509_c0~~gnl/MRDRNA2_/MRDRNA2_56509_c0_seq1.p1  ORF type:complete len:1040 (+),score=197.43 gnl/MRDRNA2_/MRDRNA2_56509_c0_seq1:51-3170(+)
MAGAGYAMILLLLLIQWASFMPHSVVGAEKAPSPLLAGTEEDALKILEGGYDFRQITFDDIEAFVQRSWWRLALHVVRSSHQKKLDYTAPVRRAVQKMKGDADELMKWLSADFAIPQEVPCDMRWAQNDTFVVIAARFTHQWDLPGAKLSVFTTKGGQGHIDVEKTNAALKDIFSADVSSSKVYAGLIGSSGYARKLYNINVSLFDEIDVRESSWKVEFVRARGSMQMSKGAAIPELRMWLRKRWPATLLWPRLTLLQDDADVVPWSEAEEYGMLEETSEMSVNRVKESSQTCLSTGPLYCPATDQCVNACLKCEGYTAQTKDWTRCHKLPWTGDVSIAKFTDDDLLAGFIKGTLQWQNVVPDAHTWVIRWGRSANEAFEDTPLSSGIWLTDETVVGTVPEETAVPEGATHLLALAATSGGKSEKIVAVAPIVDRVEPPALLSFLFYDDDPRRHQIKGIVRARLPQDRSLIQSYVLYWGYRGREQEEIQNLGVAATWTTDRAVVVASRNEHEADQVELELSTALPTDKQVPNVLMLHSRNGDVDSAEVTYSLSDICAPASTEGKIVVYADEDPSPGSVGFQIVLHKLPADSEIDGYNIYWADSHGKQLSKLIEMKSASSSRISQTVPHGTKIPDKAVTLLAIARNAHGQAPGGPFYPFDDWDQKAVAASWEASTMILGTPEGKIALLDVLSTSEVLKKKDFGITHYPVSSIKAIANGTRAWVGYHDGSLRHWDLDTAFRLQTIEGSKKGSKKETEEERRRSRMRLHAGPVSVIAVDWDSSMIVSGSKDEWLHVWDFHFRQTLYELQHEGSVRALVADWTSGKLLSGSGDGALRLLNLKCAAEKRQEQEQAKRHTDNKPDPVNVAMCTQKFQVVPDRLERRLAVEGFDLDSDSGCHMAIAADLSMSPERVVVGADDGKLIFSELRNGSVNQLRKLIGHTGRIHAIIVDWSKGRMASAGADGLVHVWDISAESEAKAPLVTLNHYGNAVETLHADWEKGQVATWSGKDKSLRIWDLNTGICIRRVFLVAPGLPKISTFGIN